jgi:DNA-binding GntR family transcriptional regulator
MIYTKSIKHKTMALAALETMRKRILDAHYPPGHQLKQEGLAQELGMSRIPIREALLMLENEGLVRMLPHRGAVVAELTFEEIDEIFSMRLLMEPCLLERSAPKLEAEDFRELHEIQVRYVQSLERNDITNWNSINKEFHMRLYRHADSPRMMTLVANLLTESEIHTRVQLVGIPGDRERATAEHLALLQLCEAGRAEEAVTLLRAHIDHIRRGLLSMAAVRTRQGAE